MEYYIDPVVFIVGKTGGENRAVRNLLDLFAEGATIPFIARYRKEKTGNMDEVRIGEIKTLYTQFQELEKRKNAVLDTIREQEKLTPGLEKQIRECHDIRILEDLYLPFKANPGSECQSEGIGTAGSSSDAAGKRGYCGQGSPFRKR